MPPAKYLGVDMADSEVPRLILALKYSSWVIKPWMIRLSYMG